jgi:very-short-patch-repair endonuclease
MKNRILSNALTVRTRMTNEEGVIWNSIKNEKFHKIKFRKQFVIGEYIIDFYAPKYKLAIELDGANHFTDAGIVKDNERDDYLNEQGIAVLRFENGSVTKNIKTVLDLILEKVKEIEAKPKE